MRWALQGGDPLVQPSDGLDRRDVPLAV